VTILRSLLACAALFTGACVSTARLPDAGPAQKNDLLAVGVAAADITPEEPIRLTGYGNRVRPSNVIGQRLWAKALAFGTDDEGPAVLIAVDVIGVSRSITETLASRLRAAKVEPRQLAIAATHTHTGPSLSGVLPHIFTSPLTPAQQQAIDRYTRELTRRLESVALAALADRRPSRVQWAVGKAGFAAHRRVMKDGRWAAFGIDPGGPVDHDMPMLAVREPGGRLRAVLVSYACHATTFDGGDNFVHGDWPGTAKALIEQRHPGAIALVAIGAGADANPNPRGRGVIDVERHGAEIAQEVDRLLGGLMQPVVGVPDGAIRDVELAFERVPGRAEWEALAARKDAAGSHARAMLQQLDRGEAIPTSYRYGVQTWAFGRDLAMVFLPGEVVSEYGLRLKRELNRAKLWVNAYSNDVPFYVASRRMIPEGGYEVDRSMVFYGQPAPLAAGTEDLIVRTVKEMLTDDFDLK
jgi:hypothetical protein